MPRYFTRPDRAYDYRFTVVPGDIDELGHANNTAWVRWVNDAAIAHSASNGLTGDVYRELGILWVVRKHEIEYFSPALEGQELTASTWIDDLRGATSLRRTVFQREGAARPLVQAATTWALIDAATGRPRRIPSELLERYGYLAKV